MPHHARRRLARDLTDAEEAEIQRRIALDPDNPELTDEQLAQMRPAREVLPPELYAALVNRPRGRPKAERTKIEVKLRLDPEVVEAFKAQGPGWQTRMNAVLRGSIAGTKQVSPAPRRSRSASSRPGK
jgi:uncharacterized protein (DUF4415 family)